MDNYFTYDELNYISASESEALESYPYVKNNDRPNLFLPSAIEFQITNQVFSKFMREKITNLTIACDHASYQYRQWRDEDNAAKAKARKESNRLYQQRFRERQKGLKLENQDPMDLSEECKGTLAEKRKVYQSIYVNKQDNPELENLRVAWKDASAQRTELIKQWDKYVAQLRKAYLSRRMEFMVAVATRPYNPIKPYVPTNVVNGVQNGN